MNSKHQYANRISFLFNLIISTYQYSQKAYDELNKNEVDYQVSLAFAVQANTYATSALVFYHQNTLLSNPNYDSFFGHFQHFNLEILQIITEKKTNVTVLQFKSKQLKDSFLDIKKLTHSIIIQRSCQ